MASRATVPSATVARAATPRRRDQILAAATELFRERGYDATGVDDIGAVAGITGPGIYRHFRNKQEILETLLRERGTTVLAEVQAIAEQASTPQAALEALTDHYVASIVGNPGLSIVALYERRTLSSETRALVDRLERLNIEEWVHVVSQVHPDVTDAEARVMVHAALSLGVAVCNYRSGLSEDRLAELMRSMILSALLPAPTA